MKGLKSGLKQDGRDMTLIALIKQLPVDKINLEKNEKRKIYSRNWLKVEKELHLQNLPQI